MLWAGDDRRGHADDPSEIPHDPVAAFLAGAPLGSVLGRLRRGCPGAARRMRAAIRPLLPGAATAAGAVPAAQ
ncbi:hypothetical protein [Nonomuraea sp. KM90]|uniref:hypothetical protein n=1 Tax=Nonomuraea sp. KM90 TaxID=3457428 RepID=UPI003FCDF1DE